MTREQRIQQIMDCGKYIMDHAEHIYGEWEMPLSLKIIVTMETGEIPTITTKRELYAPDSLKV